MAKRLLSLFIAQRSRVSGRLPVHFGHLAVVAVRLRVVGHPHARAVRGEVTSLHSPWDVAALAAGGEELDGGVLAAAPHRLRVGHRVHRLHGAARVVVLPLLLGSASAKLGGDEGVAARRALLLQVRVVARREVRAAGRVGVVGILLHLHVDVTYTGQLSLAAQRRMVWSVWVAWEVLPLR